ncbi:hypothetical protein [Alicyclobacillus sp. SO9]|uniref:hypothetical protein n=1 Tax=Alicyclobacillus sp. SO9 TaxID=2665646 RepID=UPI0018E8E836|nr:hypothetical protein [Alicyclobacillus sp. SO9]QQE80010.1 hypothetical protein GI364_05930 [Alicyclobacillus sp. SO9]
MATRWVKGIGVVILLVLVLVAALYTYFNGTFWGRASAQRQIQKALQAEYGKMKLHQIGGALYNFESHRYDATVVFDKRPGVKYFFELNKGQLTYDGTNTLRAPIPVPYNTGWISSPTSVPPSPVKGVSVTDLNWSIGAVSPKNLSMDRQKYSFTATIENQTKQRVHVTKVVLSLPGKLGHHFLSGVQTISVDRTLKPKGYTSVSGFFIIKTKGMTKQQILGLGSIKARDFTVYVA